MVLQEAVREEVRIHLVENYPESEVTIAEDNQHKVRLFHRATHVLSATAKEEYLTVVFFAWEDSVAKFYYVEPDSIEKALEHIDDNMKAYLAAGNQVHNSFELAVTAMCRAKMRE